MKKHCLLFIIGAFLSGLLGVSHAQNISGPLSGTLGPGIYTVVGDCQVNSGDTLTILPGTEFQHTGNYEWTIYGLLLAIGSPDGQILFVRQQPIPNHRWGGIRFPSSSADGSILDHCLIDNCNNSNRFGGGIYCSYSAITLSNTTISNCDGGDGGGIYANHSAIIIEDCEIFDNEAVDNASTDGNGGGIYLYFSGDAEIRRSLIYRNHSSGA